MINSVNSVNNGYKLLLKDKVNNVYKIGDAFDDYRDLVSLEAKYDNSDKPNKINVKINFNKYDSNLYKEQESLILLLDFIGDEGKYLLPFNIIGATDHWWDIAFKINNFNKKVETISSLDKQDLADSLTVDKIDEKEGSVYLSIDLNKLREYGFIEQLPLYIQVLTVNHVNKGDYNVITDTFNDNKPWENSNFLIGALPINLALKYSKSFKTSPY